MSTLSPEPQLAAPGAGVPGLELLWLRPSFAAARLILSNAAATRIFQAETGKLLTLTSNLSAEQGTQRVLIKRIAGIEDSSRYWSPFMVLEHLRIVNDAIVRIQQTLAAGHAFPREVRTADVKPNPSVGIEAVEHYRDSARHYVERSAAALQKRSRLTHPHPWFGPLTPHGWHCLAAIHQAIHRRQLVRILGGYAGQNPCAVVRRNIQPVL